MLTTICVARHFWLKSYALGEILFQFFRHVISYSIRFVFAMANWFSFFIFPFSFFFWQTTGYGRSFCPIALIKMPIWISPVSWCLALFTPPVVEKKKKRMWSICQLSANCEPRMLPLVPLQKLTAWRAVPNANSHSGCMPSSWAIIDPKIYNHLVFVSFFFSASFFPLFLSIARLSFIMAPARVCVPVDVAG